MMMMMARGDDDDNDRIFVHTSFSHMLSKKFFLLLCVYLSAEHGEAGRE